ncbi:MAG: pseudouridine synthase [Pirellulaceae bacterium]
MPRPPKKKNAPSASDSEKPSSSEIRLQRVLANAGFGSRRKCEELIAEGRIEVDGEIVTQLGTRVNPRTSKIRVDGVPIKQPKLVYFALNKPVGIVTTNRDPQGRPRVIDMINEPERVFPVGRLDRSSEGLILLTNDGELADGLAHPRHGITKKYLVTVAGIVEKETMKQMREGIHFAEGRFQVEGVRFLRTRGQATELEIVLREGKNREIRRILARLGHKVLQLKRIAIGSLKLGDLPTGAYRSLDHRELKKLQEELSASGDPTSEVPRRRKSVAGKSKSTVGRGSKKVGTRGPSGTLKRGPKSAKSTNRKREGSDIIISSEPSGLTSGTVIGAPDLEKSRSRKETGNRKGTPRQKKSKQGSSRSKGGPKKRR